MLQLIFIVIAGYVVLRFLASAFDPRGPRRPLSGGSRGAHFAHDPFFGIHEVGSTAHAHPAHMAAHQATLDAATAAHPATSHASAPVQGAHMHLDGSFHAHTHPACPSIDAGFGGHGHAPH
jgi:hypothetical protein